jgi:hypothetical protein
MTTTYAQLTLVNPTVNQISISPLADDKGQPRLWLNLTSEELLTIAQTGNTDAVDILKLRWNKKVGAGKKPSFGAQSALAKLGIVPARESAIDKKLAAVAPAIDAIKNAAKEAETKPTKTTEDYIALGQSKGIEFVLNALAKARAAKSPNPATVAKLEGAVNFLTFNPTKPAPTKPSADVSNLAKALKASGVDVQALINALR